MNSMNPLTYGVIVAIIGMLIVFTGLIILILCVKLMGMVMGTAKKAEKPSAAAAPAPAPAPAPVVVEAAPAAPAVDDAELIAVIAAALAAYDNSGKRLVIRKVRRVSGWSDAARREQVYRF